MIEGNQGNLGLRSRLAMVQVVAHSVRCAWPDIILEGTHKAACGPPCSPWVSRTAFR